MAFAPGCGARFMTIITVGVFTAAKGGRADLLRDRDVRAVSFLATVG
jgi:hypothetical protein